MSTINTGQLKDNGFFISYRVYYEDTDAAGVVYYANYLRFAERARTEALRALGFSQRAMLENEKRGFVVRDCRIQFIAPARLDDVLTVETRVHDIKRASLKMHQKITCDTTLLSEVEVKLAVVDEQFRPARLPDAIAQKMHSTFVPST